MDLGRAKVECSRCHNCFWITLDDDLMAISEGEMFEYFCPHCHDGTWVQFPVEK